MNLRNRFVAVRLAPLDIFERRESEYEERFSDGELESRVRVQRAEIARVHTVKPIIR
jgi:hypothetical protein